MSQKYSNQTSPSPKIGETVKVEFDGEVNNVYIQAIGLFEEPAAVEYFEVLVNPGQGDNEFYAELYIEDMGEAWKIVQ